MKTRTLFPALLLVLAMLACNLPSNLPITETPTTSPIPSTTPLPPTNAPTQTAPPTNTALPTLSPTPSVPSVSPKEVNVNCRFGPGTAWVAVSALIVGQSAQITGKSSDGAWWNIVDPQNSGGRCWVSASVVNAGGNLATVPVMQAPAASVTDVTIDVDPRTISVPGCIGPILASRIKGTIETNGPATVKWHFETQLGGSMGNQTTNFETFGTKEFTVEYTPPVTAGTYWIRLIVTDPNDMQAEVSYKVEC